MRVDRITREREIGPRGFSRWIHPTMTGYVMVCCDCGLAHEMEFKAGARGPERKNGTYRWATLPRSKFGVVFRARRAEKYTARERAKLYPGWSICKPKKGDVVGALMFEHRSAKIPRLKVRRYR